MNSGDALACSGLFEPIRPLLKEIGPQPDELILNALSSARGIGTGSGQPVRFRPPRPDGLEYEQRIWLHGEVATRPGNPHDLFNALVWLTFPLTKAALNARHVRAVPGRNAARGRERDAMTHFDECGVIVVSAERGLLELMRSFQWKSLFWERRDDLRRQLRCFVVGHALYEQLQRPFRGLTGKAILYGEEEAWLERPLAAQVAAVDRRLADQLAAGAHGDPRHFQPLPLLGLPGVTPESESPAYYDDPWQFRAGRRQPTFPEPGRQPTARSGG
ncbi:DUF3025 domain-containing protein [Accumulibacter sp.]|uniref:DUF3025 domain-containing protein n=1 Tax=Accumulibacter sp. TaxID=2053492 RepID=UPI0025F922DD|nr:DUF3025 domain-containing protein [Accumulibacter sp.]MCM8596562.1 DUF3025 domain-containing protein [Accumulibacter sp.]MCM8626905.1 DUF3025 domain-containing protein [Accumulibacter sp.]MDS4050710.1 DUF3025 domain-containing protein [Accumulibacter sp.]